MAGCGLRVRAGVMMACCGAGLGHAQRKVPAKVGRPGELQAATGPLAGRRFAVWGDSLSANFNDAWQKVVIARTDMTMVLEDNRSGRRMFESFECWGNPKLGDAPGKFTAAYKLPTGQTCGQTQVGIADGTTFAAAMQSVDLIIVDLGTNDQAAQFGTAIGQVGDAANAQTFYGNMAWVMGQMENANQKLRIVLVTPQRNRYSPQVLTQQFVDAEIAYGKSKSFPVIDMMSLGGCNTENILTMTRDYTHPSDFAFQNFYGPVIAQGVLKVF